MYDLWRVGFVRRPLTHILDADALAPAEVVWLPPSPRTFQYVADPFGLVLDGVLTVFVEAFDYRDRRGEIHFYRYDETNRLIDQGLALAEPWHLSYPLLIEEGGELFMLPEGHKSGRLTLYRCLSFPDQWEPVVALLDAPAIDATVIRHGGRWWMFYALPGPEDRAMREMHLAWADALQGPWTKHAGNPVRAGFETSRPGGNAFVRDGELYLPVQDCADGYGSKIRLLRIDALTPESFDATEVSRFEPQGLLPGYEDGLHTLSGTDEVTFLDVKSIQHASSEGLIKAQYKLHRLFGRITRKVS